MVEAVAAVSGWVPPRAEVGLPPRRKHRAVAALSEVERAEHKRLAEVWGCSLGEAVRRAIRESLRAEAARRAVLTGLGGEAADPGMFG